MIFRTRHLRELSLLEKSKLYRNSLPGGQMRDLVSYGGNAYVVMAIPKENSPFLIGWSYILDSKQYTEIGVYTCDIWRRRGYGAQIIEETKLFHSKTNFPKILLSRPWNVSGRSFFDKVGIRKVWDWRSEQEAAC